MSSTHPYTCNSCQIAFKNSDLQKEHMRSEWHRYNLKRRITSLPSISLDLFVEKVLQAQAHSTAAATKAAFQKTCAACDRTYFSENAHRNHLGSQKHKNNIASMRDNEIEKLSVLSSTFSLGESINYTENMEPEEDETNILNQAVQSTDLGDQIPVYRKPIQIQKATQMKNGTDQASPSPRSSNQVKIKGVNLNRCLFCNLDSQSLGLNVIHMQKLHGMFIPERKYLVDLEGLVNYFYEKINDDHQCIYCGKLKQSIFGLQTHMRDKGHCKIPFFTEEEQLEIGEYYDFTSTYSDDSETADLEGSLPIRLAKIGKAEEADEGWETDDSEATLNLALTNKSSLKHGILENNKTDKETHENQVDHGQMAYLDDIENENFNIGFFSEYELHLPSGRIAGHRSMNKYFKQNLYRYPSYAEREENPLIVALALPENEERGRVSNLGLNNPGTKLSLKNSYEKYGMIGVTAQKKKEIASLEKRYRKVEDRGRRRSEWIVNKQNNSQKHFRDPLLQ
ncbi:Cytoplasmic 60S subunit biogenesis factor REI1 [Erysiphe necator]|nr:Cytoplasmic 60S subunit biogenesis factor REI1 [Erysiphe necator]